MEVDRGMYEQLAVPSTLFGTIQNKGSSRNNFLLSMRNNRHGRLQLQSESVVSLPLFEFPQLFSTLRLPPSPPPAISTPRPNFHPPYYSRPTILTDCRARTIKPLSLYPENSCAIPVPCVYCPGFPNLVYSSRTWGLQSNYTICI